MESQNLLIEKKDSVAVITLNRPHVLNILNTQAIQELNKAFHALSLEPEIQCVVLTGTGTVFAAGADIKEMVAMNLKAAYSFARRGQQLFDFIEAMPQVVLACVNGFALGGGCELACACDLRVLASHAKIGEPEVNLGIIPGFAGSVRLPRLIGLSSALQMVLTGEALSAQEAYRLGLANWVFDSHVVLEQTLRIATQLAQKPSQALAAAKKALRQGWDLPFAKAQQNEAKLFAACFNTEDQKEGMKAFVEKRKPEWKGK